MRRAGLAVVGASMLVVACGGGGSDSSGDTVDEAPTTTASPPATTTVETTITTTSTTTSTSTSTTTTLAPTTTLSPEQEAIAAAEAAVVNAFEARTAALVDPSNPALRENLATYWTESAIPTLLAQLDDFVENSKVLVLNEDPEAFLTILDESVRVAPDRIDVPFCRLNANTIVVRLGGIDAVLDDRIATEWFSGNVLLEEGKWKVDEVDLLNDADGEVECHGSV